MDPIEQWNRVIADTNEYVPDPVHDAGQTMAVRLADALVRESQLEIKLRDVYHESIAMAKAYRTLSLLHQGVIVSIRYAVGMMRHECRAGGDGRPCSLCVEHAAKLEVYARTLTDPLFKADKPSG